jgi:hemerythrin-like domain-containing protein
MEMKSNDILINEHDNILTMLKVMHNFAEKSVKENLLDTKIAEDIVDFVRNYADKFHHGKEEEMLFKEIEANAPTQLMGPVNVMLYEHDEGRGFMKLAAEGIEEYKKGNLSGLSKTSENLKNFARLLNDHIYKENNILYPASDRFLPAEIEAKLMEAYQHFENTEANKQIKEKYEKMITEYSTQFLA